MEISGFDRRTICAMESIKSGVVSLVRWCGKPFALIRVGGKVKVVALRHPERSEARRGPSSVVRIDRLK